MASDLKEAIIKIWRYSDRYYGVKVFHQEGIIAFKTPDPMQQHGSEEAFCKIEKGAMWYSLLNKQKGMGCNRSSDYFRITRKEKGGDWFFRLNDRGEYYPIYGDIPSEEEFAAQMLAKKNAEESKIAAEKEKADKEKVEKAVINKIAAENRKAEVQKEIREAEARQKSEAEARMELRAKEYDEKVSNGEEPRYCSRACLLEWSYKSARKLPTERVISRENYISGNY